MYSGMGDTTSLVPGFPIRTSSDQSSVDSSPRHNAASHVLHRLPVPRHPPCALKHLQHKNQFEKRNCTSKYTHKTTTPKGSHLLRARCSQPLSTNQTPHPTTKDGATTIRPHQRGATRTNRARACCLKAQQCVWQHQKKNPVPGCFVCRAPDPHPLQVTPITGDRGHPTNRLTIS